MSTGGFVTNIAIPSSFLKVPVLLCFQSREDVDRKVGEKESFHSGRGSRSREWDGGIFMVL